LVIIFANIVTMSYGINCKWWDPGMYGMVVGVVTLNLLLVITFIFTMEMQHWKVLGEEDAWTKPAQLMTAQEFDRAIQTGRKYVLLDNVVLDVDPFLKHHPGGQFVIKHNIGRNITKFFIGSYSLEGNLTPGDRRHTHSNYARKIANDLIVGYFDVPQYPTMTVLCKLDSGRTESISNDLKALYFKAAKEQPSFRRFYPGLSMLGRHFNVKKLHFDCCTRQYTICNAMAPAVCEEILRLAAGNENNVIQDPSISRNGFTNSNDGPRGLLNQTKDGVEG
jgi:hypothetical protein